MSHTPEELHEVMEDEASSDQISQRDCPISELPPQVHQGRKVSRLTSFSGSPEMTASVSDTPQEMREESHGPAPEFFS